MEIQRKKKNPCSLKEVSKEHSHTVEREVLKTTKKPTQIPVKIKKGYTKNHQPENLHDTDLGLLHV